jgi:hypothetical protein
VPFIAFACGFGWANFGIAVAGFAKSIENFSYVVSAVLTPLSWLRARSSHRPASGVGPGARELQPALPVR